MIQTVGNTNAALRKLPTARPTKLRLWIRWWEPIENILDQGRSIDVDLTFNDVVGEQEPEWFTAHNIAPKPVYDDFKYEEDGIKKINWVEYDAAHNAWKERWMPEVRLIPGFSVRDQFLMELDNKRDDDHYSDVVESIERYGFRRPLSAQRRDDAPLGFIFGDGHHRLAAAIDLGFTHVPLQLVPSQETVASDSGSWYVGRPIARTHRAATNTRP